MLDTFLSKVNEMKDGILSEVKKFQNRSFMEAVVAGCAYICTANGQIKSEEKQKMIGYIKQSEELSVFDTNDVILFFNKMIEKFNFDEHIGKTEALTIISKLKGKEEARVMVSVCCAIGASDGDFDDKEKAMVREICRELNLKPESFGL